MRTLRCKCGEAICHTSMGTQDCQGCNKCNTTFAGHPDHHRELKPHDFSIKQYDQNTGESFFICSRCNEKQPTNNQ